MSIHPPSPSAPAGVRTPVPVPPRSAGRRLILGPCRLPGHRWFGIGAGPDAAVAPAGARPGRRHREPHRAAAARAPRRRHGDRRRRDRARRSVEPRRAAAAAARRRDRAERRTRGGVRRVPARRQSRPDAGARRRPARRLVVGRFDDAGGDPARPDRTDRGAARARVEPLRRRRHRRRDPGVHAPRRQGLQRQRQRRLRHLRHRGVRRRASAAARGRSPSRCRRAARAATASTPSSTRATSATTTTATATRSRNVSASLDLPWADGQSLSASYLRNRLNAQYDGGPGFDERTITVVETWRVASRQPPRAVVDVHAVGRRRHRRQPLADGVRRLHLRHHAAAVHLAERPHAAGRGRRADARTRAARGAACHRGCVRGDRARHRRGVRRLARCASATRRCRRTCAATIRASTAADDGRHRLGLARLAELAGHRRLRHRVQGADVQRPLLPRLLQPGPRARDFGQRRGRRSTRRPVGTACASTPARSATATRSSG